MSRTDSKFRPFGRGTDLIMRTQVAALARVDTQALAPAVYCTQCTGRRPDAAGGWVRAYEGGTSAQRKGGCCCWFL